MRTTVGAVEWPLPPTRRPGGVLDQPSDDRAADRTLLPHCQAGQWRHGRGLRGPGHPSAADGVGRPGRRGVGQACRWAGRPVAFDRVLLSDQHRSLDRSGAEGGDIVRRPSRGAGRGRGRRGRSAPDRGRALGWGSVGEARGSESRVSGGASPSAAAVCRRSRAGDRAFANRGAPRPDDGRGAHQPGRRLQLSGALLADAAPRGVSDGSASRRACSRAG